MCMHPLAPLQPPTPPRYVTVLRLPCAPSCSSPENTAACGPAPSPGPSPPVHVLYARAPASALSPLCARAAARARPPSSTPLPPARAASPWRAAGGGGASSEGFEDPRAATAMLASSATHTKCSISTTAPGRSGRQPQAAKGTPASQASHACARAHACGRRTSCVRAIMCRQCVRACVCTRVCVNVYVCMCKCACEEWMLSAVCDTLPATCSGHSSSYTRGTYQRHAENKQALTGCLGCADCKPQAYTPKAHTYTCTKGTAWPTHQASGQGHAGRQRVKRRMQRAF